MFCHQCSNEWDRAHGGLTCPNCEGEFVEIVREPRSLIQNDDLHHQLSPGETRSSSITRESRPASEPPSPPLHTHPLADHNPWAGAPDPDEDDVSSFEFGTIGGGRGTFTYTSRTYRSGPGNPMPPPLFPFTPFGLGGQQTQGIGQVEGRGGIFPRDVTGQPGPAEMQDLFSMIFQTMQHGGIMGNRPVAGMGTATFGGGVRGGQMAQGPSPFDLLGAILNPSGRQGDAVWSQEAFDRILEQLAEQNQTSTAPGPAAEQAIKSLPTRTVTDDMMGSDGKAECSICMDSVEVGGTVTELPCKHWFHGDCVIAWLQEHDTCPHCRKPITKPEDQEPQSSRRRPSRHSSSIPNPFGTDGTRDRPYRVPDSPGAMRDARNAYYQNPNRSAYAETRNQPQAPGGYPSQQVPMPSRPRRHSSSQSGRHNTSRQNSDRDRGSGSGGGGGGGGGGVTGWVRNHLGMG